PAGRQPPRLGKRKRKSARQPLSDRGGYAEDGEGCEGQEEQGTGRARPFLFVHLPLHALDGTAAEPSGRTARGLPQRLVRRAAAGSRQTGPEMIRDLR